jgi:hypothetical protein
MHARLRPCCMHCLLLRAMSAWHGGMFALACFSSAALCRCRRSWRGRSSSVPWRTLRWLAAGNTSCVPWYATHHTLIVALRTTQAARVHTSKLPTLTTRTPTALHWQLPAVPRPKAPAERLHAVPAASGTPACGVGGWIRPGDLPDAPEGRMMMPPACAHHFSCGGVSCPPVYMHWLAAVGLSLIVIQESAACKRA